jgi:DNA-binding CsgD family transcriptional regulator
MTETSSQHRSRIRALVAWMLTAMVLVGIWDLLTDSPRIWRGAHGAVELAFIVLGAASAVLLMRGWIEAERSLTRAHAVLGSHRAERDHWQALAQHALRGLGEAIERQFDHWSLTRAEKETAMLLLKGYSHKDAARLSGRSERTVRQHAVSVYRKSGLAGRAELAAFFFEDMLLPAEGAPTGQR